METGEPVLTVKTQMSLRWHHQVRAFPSDSYPPKFCHVTKPDIVKCYQRTGRLHACLWDFRHRSFPSVNRLFFCWSREAVRAEHCTSLFLRGNGSFSSLAFSSVKLYEQRPETDFSNKGFSQQDAVQIEGSGGPWSVIGMDWKMRVREKPSLLVSVGDRELPHALPDHQRAGNYSQSALHLVS